MIAVWLAAVGLTWPHAIAQEAGTAETLVWDVQENRPEGFIVGTLHERFPTATSFELISDRSANGFSIDRTSGTITVSDSKSLNFEKATIATLYIRAVDSLVKESDPYAAQFASSLLEEGLSAEKLRELSHRSISIRIQIQILA